MDDQTSNTCFLTQRTELVFLIVVVRVATAEVEVPGVRRGILGAGPIVVRAESRTC